MKSETESKRLVERITQGNATQNENCVDVKERRIVCALGGDNNHLANAEFITEAFNVAHETGKSPMELAERVKKLEGLLEKAIPLLKGSFNQPEREKFAIEVVDFLKK